MGTSKELSFRAPCTFSLFLRIKNYRAKVLIQTRVTPGVQLRCSSLAFEIIRHKYQAKQRLLHMEAHRCAGIPGRLDAHQLTADFDSTMRALCPLRVARAWAVSK
mmetsp:Transcript_57776/g.135094  ORF Transcript_57776/g.135094 Transcript_57776/m.135094 type:complete len:105 (-) Transcript_57776:61-375(-)